VTGDAAGTSVDFFAAAVVLTGAFFAAAAVFVAAVFGVAVFAVFLVAVLAVVFFVAGEPGDSVCAFDIELTPVSG
jgi:hypothetical protein